MKNHESAKKTIPVKPEAFSYPIKQKKETWTLVKLKDNKYHVVSSEGRLIKIDNVIGDND